MAGWVAIFVSRHHISARYNMLILLQNGHLSCGDNRGQHLPHGIVPAHPITLESQFIFDNTAHDTKHKTHENKQQETLHNHLVRFVQTGLDSGCQFIRDCLLWLHHIPNNSQVGPPSVRFQFIIGRCVLHDDKQTLSMYDQHWWLKVDRLIVKCPCQLRAVPSTRIRESGLRSHYRQSYVVSLVLRRVSAASWPPCLLLQPRG